MSVSVSVGGNSEVGSAAITYSVSDDVLSDLYRSLKLLIRLIPKMALTEFHNLPTQVSCEGSTMLFRQTES